jgi:hypothetical protein
MKKLASLIAVVALLGAGCAPASTPTPSPAPTPSGSSIEVPAAESGHPPAVVMSVGEEIYPGVEGSYCYDGVCADKISPQMLVSEAGLVYKAVEGGTNVYFTVGPEDVVFEFAVNMMNASGTDLGLRMPVSFRNGQYFAKIPSSVTGKNIVLAFVRFGQTETGGDVTYAFPVDVR